MDVNSTTESPEGTSVEDLLAEWIPLFLGPIGSFGSFCNIFVILTVAHLGDSASGLAVQLLAVWDTLAVVLDSVLELGLMSFFQFDVFTIGQSKWVCKLLKLFDWIGNHISNWHVVIICLDRYISVAFPLFYFKSWTKKHVWLCSCSVTIFTLVTQAPFLYFFTIRDGECVLHPGVFSDTSLNVFMFVQIYGLYFIAPGIAIIVLSTLFFVKLKTSGHAQTNNPTGEAPSNVNQKNMAPSRMRMENAIRRMAISLILSYVVLSSLVAGVFFSEIVTDNLEWLYIVGEALLALQNTSSLFFYLLSGPTFRQAFWTVVTSMIKKRPRKSRNSHG